MVIAVDRLGDRTFCEEAYKKNMFALLGKPEYDGAREAQEARLKGLE